jgi:hypothetical protein
MARLLNHRRRAPALILLAWMLSASALRADVAGWSDAVWNAARKGDAAAFDLEMGKVPPGEGPAIEAVRAAIAQRDAHRQEAAKARDEAIAKHRADLRKDLDAGDLSRALIAAANLKFLLEPAEWTAEMATPNSSAAPRRGASRPRPRRTGCSCRR